MSEVASPQLSNTRVAMLSVIVTAVSGIIIAFVGVLPQMSQAADALPQVVSVPSATPEAAWRITGRVADANGDGSLSQIFLIPSSADYQTFSGDKGEFVFENVPTGYYSIVVRNPSTTISGLIEVKRALAQEEDFQAVHVTYSVNQQ